MTIPTGTSSDTHSVNVQLREDGSQPALLPAGSDTGSVSLTVNNVEPEIVALSITGPIDEGGTATLSGTYTDVGTLDTHELDIDWNGDGSLRPDRHRHRRHFSVSHQYSDDNPTGTASDTFNVNVRLRDDDTGSDTGSVEPDGE